MANVSDSSTYIIYCFACGVKKRILARDFGLTPKKLLCMDCYVDFEKSRVIHLQDGDNNAKKINSQPIEGSEGLIR